MSLLMQSSLSFRSAVSASPKFCLRLWLAEDLRSRDRTICANLCPFKVNSFVREVGDRELVSLELLGGEEMG